MANPIKSHYIVVSSNSSNEYDSFTNVEEAKVSAKQEVLTGNSWARVYRLEFEYSVAVLEAVGVTS